MTESTRWDDERLAGALRALGPLLAGPREADLAPIVGARLRREAAARPQRVFHLGRGTRRGLILAFAALLLLGGVAVAGKLGVPGVDILFRRTLPTPSVAPPPPGHTLDLGRPTSLLAAGRAAGFAVLLPNDPLLGPPDAVFFDARAAFLEVSLVWRPRPGLTRTSETGVGALVVEFNSRVDQAFLEKIVSAGVTVEPVRVNGGPGYWISGIHEIAYVGPGGGPVFETMRLAGPTLVWQHDGVTLRLESSLPKAEALRIARSFA